jgi:hypothetical protein
MNVAARREALSQGKAGQGTAERSLGIRAAESILTFLHFSFVILTLSPSHATFGADNNCGIAHEKGILAVPIIRQSASMIRRSRQPKGQGR